jgi:hypothetical protein
MVNLSINNIKRVHNIFDQLLSAQGFAPSHCQCITHLKKMGNTLTVKKISGANLVVWYT